MAEITDQQRLDWLSTQSGYGVINDGNGRWALSESRFQTIQVENSIQPYNASSVYFVLAHEWRSSIRAAVDSQIMADQVRET